MAIGTASTLATMIGTLLTNIVGGAGGEERKRDGRPTGKEVGKPTPGDTGAGGTPSEGGGVTFRPKPEERRGRPSPTTRFPFGSSILGEGRSLFPDVSVTGTGTPRSQPTAGAVRSTRRRRTGFGIA